MSNLTVENVYTRHQAKLLAKKHFWKLLGMTLIVMVIVYAIYGAGLLLVAQLPGAVATTRLTTTSASYNVNGGGELYILAMLALMLIVMLVGGGLALGLTDAMIALCRGETITISRVFSRMGQCLKALGLALWVGLKTVLWALPVYALGAVGIVFILTSMNGKLSAEAEVILTLLPLLLMVLVFVLVIPAVYRYLLSTYILADKPETGIRACVNESKALMKGHKWQAFKLVVPTVLILYGMMILLGLAFALVTTLLAEMSQTLTIIVSVVCIIALLVMALYYAIRMGLGYCIFYLNRQNKGVVEEPAAE